MKYCVEFGKRGGYHIDNLVFPSKKLALQTFVSFINTLSDAKQVSVADFDLSSKSPRHSWKSSGYFASISLLDGVDRGAASNQLWKKT